MLAFDTGQRVSDPIRDRLPCPFDLVGGATRAPAQPVRRTQFGGYELQFLPQGRDAKLVAGGLGIGELFLETRDAFPIGRTRRLVEEFLA